MPNRIKNIDALIFKFLQQTCTQQELQQLEHWIESSEANRLHFENLTDQQYLAGELAKFNNYSEDAGWQKIKAHISPQKKKKFNWLKPAAAAAAIIAISTIYFLYKPLKTRQENFAQQKQTDVFPGTNKATLTLADGSTITLDDSENDTLAQQGQTKIFNLKGKLSYRSGAKSTGEILYNTITTPAGGQYQVILPDGTHVWLNASSSIRFPTTFTGTERSIAITGEAYLEVTHNKKFPFVVNVNGSKVKVLGTSFDVMAYQDESALEVTLLEGSVKFNNENSEASLKPGEQSRLTRSGTIKVVKDVDVERIMAWKNGFFYFDNADIETVMRQLARWYDVKIIYRNKNRNDLFHADIPRNMKLSEVLKALELAGDLHFQIDGKNIIVI